MSARTMVLVSAVVLTLSACSSKEWTSDDKAANSTEGWFQVQAEGLSFDDTLTTWQASLRASDDMSAALEGREEVVYQLIAGAASSDDSQAFSVRVYSDTWESFLTGAAITLDSGDTGEYRNQVDAKLDSTFYISEGGTLTITSLTDGEISGSVSTTLVEPGQTTGAATSATFEGLVEPSCNLYSFPESGEGEWLDVGLENERCSELFE